MAHGELEKAFQIWAEQQVQHPDRRPRGIRRDFDFTILGTLLGATIGVISINFSQHIPMRVLAWAGVIGSGMLVGYFADRFRRSHRYLGHLQFEIRDCLLITAGAAGLIAFWTCLARLL